MLLHTKEVSGLAQDLAKHHQRYFENALEEFCDMSWPCGFSNEKGQCVNAKSRHNSKGHQNDRGKIIATGNYRSTFSAFEYGPQWKATPAWFSISEYSANKISANANICSANIQYLQHF